jgi:hypothetical protein
MIDHSHKDGHLSQKEKPTEIPGKGRNSAMIETLAGMPREDLGYSATRGLALPSGGQREKIFRV